MRIRERQREIERGGQGARERVQGRERAAGFSERAPKGGRFIAPTNGDKLVKWRGGVGLGFRV